MTWTYDPSQLAEGGKDAVRFLVQDTDTADQLIQDEEIEFALTEGGSKYRAAEIVCRAIAAQLARKASINNKDSGIVDDMQAKADRYLTLADEYREKATRTGLTVFAGGISQSDKDARSQDSDSTPPSFRRDLHQSQSLPGTPTPFSIP